MKFGPVPPKAVPQQNPTKVMVLAEKWQRAASAHARWAEPAKRCVDFFEGRQWTEDQLRKMKGRPALKFNVIAPLVRLILGYHRSNKTDIVFKPGQDARSSEQVAEALTRIGKSIATISKLEFVDTEVFLDGLITARGFFDTRLDFENNDLGEIKTRAADPFTTYPDPDADTYDLGESASYIQTSKWTSLDEIESAFGKGVGDLLKPWTMGQTPLAPAISVMVADEITPMRTFGQREDMLTDWWDQFYSLSGDFVDTYRKTIRVIESQYKVREPRNVMIDLETGDKTVLVDKGPNGQLIDWTPDKIQKGLFYAKQVNNPCVVQARMVERVHWSVMAGDLLLYDAPSLYDDFTITGYFPYFRRGMTRGMVEDLIDPQLQKNKHRNAAIEIVAKTANGGWSHHEDALDPVQEANLKKYGSQPGVVVKWKGSPDGKPVPIDATGNPLKHERLEQEADQDMRTISGVNESALGNLDRVQSGRAIEARQRQAVLSVQVYMDNFKRSKDLVGSLHLSMIQKFYTEQRMFRVLGEDGKFAQTIVNQQQQDPRTGLIRIVNDVTIGKYAVAIDDAPISATFLDAQWEQMMELIEKLGPAMGPKLPMFADLMIDMSNMPRKQEWIQRLQSMNQPQKPPPPTDMEQSEINRNNAQAEQALAGAWKNVASVTLDQTGMAMDLANQEAGMHQRQLQGAPQGAPAALPAPAPAG